MGEEYKSFVGDAAGEGMTDKHPETNSETVKHVETNLQAETNEGEDMGPEGLAASYDGPAGYVPTRDDVAKVGAVQWANRNKVRVNGPAELQYTFGEDMEQDERWFKDHGGRVPEVLAPVDKQTMGTGDEGPLEVAPEDKQVEVPGAVSEQGDAEVPENGGESKGLAATDVDAGWSEDDKRRMREDSTRGIDEQIKLYRDWLDAEEHRPESAEERKRRERKERSKRIVAAISDGLSALGNLYFTMQYGPNMYNHEKQSLLTPLERRLEKEKAEREKRSSEYFNNSVKSGALEHERARTVREMEEQFERVRLARDKARREEQEHVWKAVLQDDIQREQKGKADTAGYTAEIKRLDAQNKPTEIENKNNLDVAKVDTESAKKGKIVADTNWTISGKPRAGGGGKGGRGKGGGGPNVTKTVTTKDGPYGTTRTTTIKTVGGSVPNSGGKGSPSKKSPSKI